MSRNYKFHNKEGLYFVSFAVVYWIDVFVREVYCEKIIEGFKFCQEEKGMEIYAWCIMPSHIHIVFKAKNNNPSDVIRDFKRNTSKELQKAIEENIQESRKEWMLWMMERAGKKNSNVKNRQFWQQHNKPIELWSNEVILLPIFAKNYYENERGNKVYELTSHLGNVHSVVADRKMPIQAGSSGNIDYYTADVVSNSDYYPFGSLMPQRFQSAEKYRYGWNNGSEKDDEITGVEGTHITTFFREYDTRLGRTWSLDPVFQPWQSSYSSMDNNPIWFNDPLGDEVRNKHQKERNETKDKRDNAQSVFDNKFKDITGEQLKEDKSLRKEYNLAKKELDNLNKAFEKIDEKFQAVEDAIQFLKNNFEEEFNKLDNIKIGGKTIDVDVEAHSFRFYKSPDPVNGTIHDISNNNYRIATGFTISPSITSSVNEIGNKFFRVGITFKIRSIEDVRKTLYHEFRHIHYKLHPTQLKKDEETQVQEDTENSFEKFR